MSRIALCVVLFGVAAGCGAPPPEGQGTATQPVSAAPKGGGGGGAGNCATTLSVSIAGGVVLTNAQQLIPGWFCLGLAGLTFLGMLTRR